LRAAGAAIYICGLTQNGTMKSLAPYEEFGVQIALRSVLSPTALGRLTCEDIFVPGLLRT